MLILSLVLWWYTAGWVQAARNMEQLVTRMLRAFSVTLLLRTMFDPYRQIAAGRVNGSLQTVFQAWLDRLFSRIVGAVVRVIVIFCGLLSAFGMLLLGIIAMAAWPLVPLLPVAALVGLLVGWTP